MRAGAGRKSSPLDEIRPARWTTEMTKELLELIWVLEATIALCPEMESSFDEIVSSDLFEATELPQPSMEERKPAVIQRDNQMSMETE